MMQQIDLTQSLKGLFDDIFKEISADTLIKIVDPSDIVSPGEDFFQGDRFALVIRMRYYEEMKPYLIRKRNALNVRDYLVKSNAEFGSVKSKNQIKAMKEEVFIAYLNKLRNEKGNNKESGKPDHMLWLRTPLDGTLSDLAKVYANLLMEFHLDCTKRLSAYDKPKPSYVFNYKLKDSDERKLNLKRCNERCVESGMLKKCQFPHFYKVFSGEVPNKKLILNDSLSSLKFFLDLLYDSNISILEKEGKPYKPGNIMKKDFYILATLYFLDKNSEAIDWEDISKANVKHAKNTEKLESAVESLTVN